MVRTSKREAYIEPAKRYVDEQLATMQKHGTARQLTGDEYKRLVEKVAKATMK